MESDRPHAPSKEVARPAGPSVVLDAAPAHRRPPPARWVPFGRPVIGEAERQAVLEVLSGPILTHGPVVKQFEQAFAAFTGAPHAVATSSCTAALQLAYMFLGLGPGDEVILPAQTHVAAAHAVELAGARCVFVDAEPRTGNVDLERIPELVTERTRAVCVVHYLGLPVDMVRLAEIAGRHDLFIVEDCALAVGATLDGVHAGLHGDAGCFSFYPVKHITTAEGGMVITRRDDVARTVAAQRAFGIDRNIVSQRPVPGRYDVPLLGNNYRMNEISAALGLAQTKRLDALVAARKANYEMLSAGLARIDEVETLRSTGGRFRSGYFCQSVLLRGRLRAKRARIMDALGRRGIGVSVYYPKPIPLLGYYRRKYGFADNSFPVASHLSAHSIALPVGPHLDSEDIEYLIASVKDAIVDVK
ncbi:MAG: DegT/DnrJ/EryC1/StrS family aminotransferase [Planctomycetota bacterium]|jgi:dTDP-4-amino-4,6-dideoxygalactose transaminase